jgi:hypothetical protein
VATLLLLHLRDGELRDVKEAREVDAQHSRVISLGVSSERLGDDTPALLMSVSMRPSRATASEIARSAVFRSVISPGTARIWSSFVDLIDRAVATTP